MSRIDNVENLEKQLAELQMTKDISATAKVKKIPPAVPPKKKAQPQVPHSAAVSSVCEPSYSSKISPVVTSAVLNFGDMYMNNVRTSPDYANTRRSNVHSPINLYNQRSPVPSRNYNATYSNSVVSHRNTHDHLPPPPPPPLPQSSSLHINKSLDSDHNSEEYLPPPSPVSSNYSELALATANLTFNQERPNYPPIYQNEYPAYGTSQASTYESLYEPINPRPQSSFSIRTNNSTQNYHNTNTTAKSPLSKEAEVDALTNLLVQSISDSQDLDVFGICIKCDEKVVGENSGCTAMGNLYHVKCFCCHRCQVNLQGKPFYDVEGEPYCEVDYYQMLEKCSVCRQPILDRILRATGKPYHPKCFTCVVCGKSLDGIPFTVDAVNQIHCIEDFHKKFAPRCCVCEMPIMPEEGEEETVRVVALDRSFHVKCYRCEDCGMLLSSESEGRGCYPLDDHILCKTCNGHRIRMLTNVMTTDL